MLSWKLMKATEAACQYIGMGEEAAVHYGYTYTRLDRWNHWWRGFVAGWLDDCDLGVPLTHRVGRAILRRLALAP
ncbi:hypothetical protein G3A43_06270 [Paraburkholderia aspalathi]|nr:hypothetical protein [Paraburkholderia aspalathi]MBK3779853.1 hypothetical protein [Paraburkholderia aspalathi]